MAKQRKKHISPFFSFASFFLLSIVLIILVSQIYDQQETRTRAQNISVKLVSCDIDAMHLAMDADEQKFLTLINTYRQQNNAGPLQTSSSLTQAAAWMVHDSAVRKISDHTDSLNRSPQIRLQNCGFNSQNTPNFTDGENVAFGEPTMTADQAFTAWKNSPPHNTNMLNPEFTFIGIGKEGNAGDYWVTDFGNVPDVTGVSPTQSPTPTAVVTQAVTPTPSPRQLTPTPQSGNGETLLTLTLFLDGIGKAGDRVSPNKGGNTNILRMQRNSTVSFLSNTNAATLPTQNILVQFNPTQGSFTGTVPLQNFVTGNYIVKISLDGFLSQQTQSMNITANQTTTVAPLSFVAGDVTGDDKLDVADYTTFINCFGSKVNTSLCLKKTQSDLNDDGVIDGQDYNLLLRELTKINN